MNKTISSCLLSCLFYLPLLVNAAGNAALAMPDSYSAQTVKKVLDDGGNAVDATIAAQFALVVTFPEAVNIGGGGFMTIALCNKPP